MGICSRKGGEHRKNHIASKTEGGIQGWKRVEKVAYLDSGPPSKRVKQSVCPQKARGFSLSKKGGQGLPGINWSGKREVKNHPGVLAWKFSRVRQVKTRLGGGGG